ncbi:MAG TPA: hypothetical protein VMW62_05160 [Chloroflexota bacterium]|nr:hypothetical protein [Chloroflexota bacterium]
MEPSPAPAGRAAQLLLDIARCPVAQQCLKGAASACSTIVATQPADRFHLPEPWNGDLERAPILFLSSNPSIGPAERYPLSDWDNARIADFFTHRFGGAREPWTTDGLHPLLLNGSYDGPVSFWASVRARAAELLPDGQGPRPGVDYAISEAVHCKSAGELGVEEALEECGRRYLWRTVEMSGSKLVVVLGRLAAHAVRGVFGLSSDSSLAEQLVGGQARWFAFLPHPGAHVPAHTFAACLPDELPRLKDIVRASLKEH